MLCQNATSNEELSFRLARRTTGLKPSTIREILKVTETPEVISFAGGLPAPELFPVSGFAQACREVLAEDGEQAMQYGVTEGYAPLRRWVCEHLQQTVDLQSSPDQVLITDGSQQGLDLVARALLDPGDVVLVTDPTYLGAMQVFQACEARVLGIASDDDGLRTDELRSVLRKGGIRPKLLYLVPNFHNPTGVSMSTLRRRETVEIAAEFGVPVLEDDPYGRLRYSGENRPSLASLDPRACIHLGTSSKIMAPGMRVAWMVVPNRELREKLVPLKQASNLHTSTFTQRVVWKYASRPGELEAHVRKLLAVYGRRRDVMLSALGSCLPAGCSWTRPDGGLFVWVRVPGHLDTSELLRQAMTHKVAFVPGEPFWVSGKVRNTLRLNFSNASDDRIEEGIRRLGDLIRAAAPARPGDRRHDD